MDEIDLRWEGFDEGQEGNESWLELHFTSIKQDVNMN